MVVLEAMAAGVPVIASSVEGIPEAIRHREEGLLVEPGSVSQLALAIEDLVGSPVDCPSGTTPDRLPRNERRRSAASCGAILSRGDGGESCGACTTKC